MVRLKLYDPVFDEKTGNVSIQTELTPDEIRALLSFAILQCVAHGMIPKSLAPFFKGQIEEPEAKTAEEEKAQQLSFLDQFDVKDLPQA